MRTPFALALPLLLAPIALAQEAPVVRSYDLGEVVPRRDGSDWTVPLLVPPARIPWSGGGEVADEPAEALVEVLMQLLGDELRQQGRAIEYDGSRRLVVVAPQALQDTIRGLLDGMRSAFQAELAVEVEVLRLPGTSALPTLPTSVLAGDAAARLRSDLLARGAEVESHVLHLRAGRTGVAQDSRFHPFVSRHVVEIAQGALIFDPEVEEAEEGTLVALRAAPLPGGAHLTCALRTARLDGPIETVALALAGSISSEREGLTPVPGPDKMELARVGVQAVAFETFLPDGKTLVVALHDASGAQPVQVVVLLRREGGAIPELVRLPFGSAGRALVLVNGERIRPPRLELLATEVGEQYAVEHPALAARWSSELPLVLRDWVKGRFATWRALGPWLALVSDPTWDAGSDALQALLDGATPDVGTRELSLVARADDERELASCSLPLLAGGKAAVLLGTTRTELIDYEVEVAQLASAPSLVVRPLFDGLAVVAGVSGGAGRSLVASLAGSLRARGAERRSLVLGGPLPATLQLGERRWMRLDERAQLDDRQGQPARARFTGGGLRVEMQVR